MFFLRLSLQHPVRKFLGECNDIKRSLSRCLKEEVFKSFLSDIHFTSLVEGTEMCYVILTLSVIELHDA